jgi:ribosomal protein S18 acetylase RimI-like enzyme
LCDLRNSWLAWSPSANKLAGVALSYIWPGASALYLEQLVVHPTFRGKGLGRALLSSVCGPLSDGSVQKVVLTVSTDNHPASAFIKSSGAQPIHSEFAFKQELTSSQREHDAEHSHRGTSPKAPHNQPEPVLG